MTRSAEPGLRADEKLVFMHVPKTAGTSLHEMLSERFEPREICPERSDLLQGRTDEELSRFRFFSGHFGRFSVDRVRGPKRVVTFLREPRSRIVSLYHFWRSHRPSTIERDGLAGPAVARRLDLLAFLRSDHPEVIAAADNSVTRQLLGPPRLVPGSGFRPEEREFCVETAMQGLRRFFFVGFQEHFSDDVPRLMAMLGGDPSRPPARSNTAEENASHPDFETVERHPITPAVERELRRLTSLDSPLYERALRERLALHNPYPM